MNHVRARELLNDSVEGELSPALGAQLEAHLAGCDACTRELDELRRTLQLLRALPDPEPPPYLATRVMARLADGEGRAPRWARAFGFLSSPAFATSVAAGFACLLLVTALEIGPGALLGPGSGPSPQADAVRSASGAVAGVRYAGQPTGSAPSTRDSSFPRPRFTASLVSDGGGEARRTEPSAIVRGASAGFVGHAVFDSQAVVLERQLDTLLANPHAFLDGMSDRSLGQRYHSLGALAEYAAMRGHAVRAAELLRGVHHPLAGAAAERFERTAFDR